jgi:hypothetical protein
MKILWLLLLCSACTIQIYDDDNGLKVEDGPSTTSASEPGRRENPCIPSVEYTIDGVKYSEPALCPVPTMQTPDPTKFIDLNKLSDPTGAASPTNQTSPISKELQ